MSLGPYPAVSLLDARAARDGARASLRDGRDPTVVKRQHRTAALHAMATTFSGIAREWFALNKSRWSPRHADDVIGSLERDVFPIVGALPIRKITPQQALSELRKIEARPAIETAHRIRQRMSAVFVYAIASGRGGADPAATVQGAMAPLHKGRYPAITGLDDARLML